MPPRTPIEVHNFLTARPDAKEIATAFSLRSLVVEAIYHPSYASDPRWTEALAFTDEGRALLADVAGDETGDADLCFAMFGIFWFANPLIDASNSNLELIQTIIETEAKEHRIRWPMTQGRELYDRYASLFGASKDSLSSQESHSLLDGTSQGIYQSGYLVTGPLGLIESQVPRYYPPADRLGLWHCPMIDCGELHPVRLQPPSIPLTEKYDTLFNAAIERWGNRARWQPALRIWPYPIEDDWRVLSPMPLFLGDCIVSDDRNRLFIRALLSPHQERLRAVLRTKRYGNPNGDPSALALRTPTDVQLQLLLTLPDAELKKFIDELVWKREIEVPADELREVDKSKLRLYGSTFESSLEMSSLGIRTVRQHPILHLRQLLWHAYMKNDEIRDLDWRLKKPAGVSSQDALMSYMRKVAPPVAIDSLVLASPRVTAHVAGSLDTSIETPDDRARVLLEWKLGFNLPREERRITAMRQVLENFKVVAQKVGNPQNDSERQAIRGAGVNAFVEFEGFLDEMIAYLTWCLYSDHPKITRFTYSRSAAMECVSQVLGLELSSGNEKTRWSQGGNTLGVCLRYLQRLNESVAALPNMDRTPLLRPSLEINLPDSDAVRTFPFTHTQLWADAILDSLSQLSNRIAACCDVLGRADVPSIRNGLEHYREPHRFPSAAKILSAAESMATFVDLADNERLIPKLYWVGGSKADAFSQQTVELVDYRGSVFELHFPRTVSGLPTIFDLSPTRPALVAPGNLFGGPNAEILFRIARDSVYSKFWQNYPIPRNRTHTADDV